MAVSCDNLLGIYTVPSDVGNHQAKFVWRIGRTYHTTGNKNRKMTVIQLRIIISNLSQLAASTASLLNGRMYRHISAQILLQAKNIAFSVFHSLG